MSFLAFEFGLALELYHSLVKVPVATRLDILGIYLDCYEGVNRYALHSAS